MPADISSIAGGVPPTVSEAEAARRADVNDKSNDSGNLGISAPGLENIAKAQIVAPALITQINAVSDKDFIKAIQTVKAFKDYVGGSIIGRQTESSRLKLDVDEHNIYKFYAFYYDSKGRRPTSDEWLQLSLLKEKLFDRHNPKVVLFFYRSQPIFWIKRLPLWLLVCATVAFVMTSVGGVLLKPYSTDFAAAITLCGYLVWTLSLGSLGATAYLAVNALGLETESPFDISDLNSVLVRIVIGGVFGFIIALTISLPAFVSFSDIAWKTVINSSSQTSQSPPVAITKEVISLDLQTAWRVLLPFILGFSTSLVLTVLNRLIVVVETFFGVTRRTP